MGMKPRWRPRPCPGGTQPGSEGADQSGECLGISGLHPRGAISLGDDQDEPSPALPSPGMRSDMPGDRPEPAPNLTLAGQPPDGAEQDQGAAGLVEPGTVARR